MLTIDRAAGAALVLVGLGALWESRRYPLGSLAQPGPAYMPVLLAGLLVVFGLLLVAGSARSGRLREVAWPEWRHALGIFAAAGVAAFGLERLGYRLTMGLVLLFLLGRLERQGPVLTLILTAAIAGGSFFLFDTLLKVPLPRGPFGF